MLTTLLPFSDMKKIGGRTPPRNREGRDSHAFSSFLQKDERSHRRDERVRKQDPKEGEAPPDAHNSSTFLK